MLSIRKVRLLITSRYIAMQSYECVIISKMFLIYFLSYGCNGGALVFLGGAEASASPSFALPMFITIKKIIILHLFLGVPAATVGGTGTPVATPLAVTDGFRFRDMIECEKLHKIKLNSVIKNCHFIVVIFHGVFHWCRLYGRIIRLYFLLY